VTQAKVVSDARRQGGNVDGDVGSGHDERGWRRAGGGDVGVAVTQTKGLARQGQVGRRREGGAACEGRASV